MQIIMFLSASFLLVGITLGHPLMVREATETGAAAAPTAEGWDILEPGEE